MPVRDKKKVLIIVDVQNDFVTGELRNEDAIKTVPNIVAKAHEYINNGGVIVFTHDMHHADDYLDTEEGKKLPVPHCIIDTEGYKLVPQLQELYDTGMAKEDQDFFDFDKFGFGSLELGEFLFECDNEIESVELVGFCTDICVIANAIIAKSALKFAPVYVDASCCAGISPESHDNALKAMQVCHINIKNQGKEPWRIIKAE